MEDIKMDTLSKAFSDLLFSKFPEFSKFMIVKEYSDTKDEVLKLREAFINELQNNEEYTEILNEHPGIVESFFPENHNEYEGGYIDIKVPHGEEILNITTVGNEITIGFSWYHIHFNSDRIKESISFIEKLINEDIAIFAQIHNNVYKCCGYIKVEELEQLRNRVKDDDVDHIEIKSWNGSYDARF